MQLSTRYNHRPIENVWMKRWLESHLFEVTPRIGQRRFSIVIPPPNVTGSLHVGHALDNILQDIFVRWQRMCGAVTLWVPGMDHAGIATQSVMDRQLARENITRLDLGREAFIERVWAWKEEYAQRIRTQLHRLGASCDWSHERFTLDPGFSRAVRTAFLRLNKDGLVYRGEYIVNWCPQCGTALSDLEVEYHEVQGKLYWLRYPMAHGDGYLTVATTRPETMLGDTAVAVNPMDDRYRDRIGQSVLLPLVNREIPIIADPAVDPEFGSGAVKVTPGHDPTDFEIGRRHNLPLIVVMDFHAHMNDQAGPYRGLNRFEARQRVLEDLISQNLLEKVEPYKHSVGHCYRCDTIVEPMVSPQWFVRMKPLAERAIDVYQKRRLPRFIPENWGVVYLDWLENIRDWCVSRQIWWGHPIPAWHCSSCGTVTVSDAPPQSCPCGGSKLEPDPDVLDTWFSSSLWPMAVFGWPDTNEDLAYFYPTDLLVTGFDIIFFWVARMVMMGLYFSDVVPFRDVVIHGLVRDEKGHKMSKTRGNVIDPMDIIDDMGADALRLTFARLAAPGMDIPFSLQQISGYRTFLNKLWNAERFVLMQFRDDELAKPLPDKNLDLSDRWILSRLQTTIRTVHSLLEDYSVNEASRGIYNFFWNDFCDWYIEIAKLDLKDTESPSALRRKSILVHVLDYSLRLLHPFIPFVTEELWQKLPLTRKPTDFLAIAPFPEVQPHWVDKFSESRMNNLIEVISKVRQIRSELGISPTKGLKIRIYGSGRTLTDLKESVNTLQGLANLDTVDWVKPEHQTGWVYDTTQEVELELEVGPALNLEREKDRLSKELTKAQDYLKRLEEKLGNPNFKAHAPSSVVDETCKKQDETRAKILRLETYLKELFHDS